MALCSNRGSRNLAKVHLYICLMKRRRKARQTFGRWIASFAVVFFSFGLHGKTCEDLFRSNLGAAFFFELKSKVDHHLTRLQIRLQNRHAQFTSILHGADSNFSQGTILSLEIQDGIRPAPYDQEGIANHLDTVRSILEKDRYLRKLGQAHMAKLKLSNAQGALRESVEFIVRRYTEINLNGNSARNALRRIQNEFDPRVSSPEAIQLATDVTMLRRQIELVRNSIAYLFLQDQTVAVDSQLARDLQALIKASQSDEAFDVYVARLQQRRR